MNSDIEIIKGRLTLLFKRRPQTRYWLMVDCKFNPNSWTNLSA
ncbi:hypothetical protein FAM19404_00013 [Lacticaseibacillus paracasei]|nr:hypothetical protein FAM19404_00013 [Lacticaseibacillus paracasei]